MSWADRRYDDDQFFRPRPTMNSTSLFWLLGILVGAHVLKAILVGTHLVPVGWVERWFGVSRATFEHGYVWQVLTYQFVHGGTGHLFMNALVLFLAGRLLEPLVGAGRVVVLCLGCGAFASLATLFPGTGDRFTIGISGGISALWVIAWCLAPNLPVNILIAVVRLKWVCLLILTMDLLGSLGDGMRTFDDTSSQVAYEVHLCGAFAGFCVAFVWPRLLKPRVTQAQAKVARKREVAKLEQEMGAERELDRILAKINSEGMSALTDQERQFLKRRASQGSTRRP